MLMNAAIHVFVMRFCLSTYQIPIVPRCHVGKPRLINNANELKLYLVTNKIGRYELVHSNDISNDILYRKLEL